MYCQPCTKLELGLGVWQGRYQDVEQPSLRWYDWTGCWVLTSTEQERQRAERLIAQLRRHEVACR
ncbi:MAG: hypothetical protein V7K38_15990 [Nostoc sp.]|uniref:hypothetical protein n=1 Tax=Nostoc sp. TaxID=1180 RepID=UPI002FF7E420